MKLLSTLVMGLGFVGCASSMSIMATSTATTVSTTTTTGSPFSGPAPVPPFSVQKKIGGLAVGPYVLSGQDPNLGTVIPENQLQYLLSDAAQYAVWVRTFGCSSLQNAGSYIHQAGSKAMIGAYLANPNTTASAQANQQELDCVVAVANAGHADIVAVGNETLQFNTLTEAQLLADIAYVKSRVPATVQVSTVDTWNALVAHPNVIASADIVLCNVYPFWENSVAASALTTLQSDYAQMKKASGTKTIYIAETGWPSSGAASSQAPLAIPSQANQVAYFLGIEQWAEQNNVTVIFFEGFNEPFKANYGDYPTWGIFDGSYALESPFAGAFQ
jgi:GPH family glycoside/pentoside/hexuronide:cation symporter